MEMVELEKVCQIRNGYAFKSNEFKKKGVPLLRISNFDDGEVFINEKTVFVDGRFLEEKKNFIVEKGDVLIALSGATTGKFGVYNYDFPSLLNQRIGLLKSGLSKELSSNYFYYYLNVLKREILRQAGGAAQPNISTKAIGELKIPLPPLETQKKIAAILDEADKLRQLDKQLIEKYDELTQSLFLDMFGEKGKYKQVIIEDLVTKITDGTHHTPKYTDSGVPFLRVTDITKSNDSKKFISRDEHEQLIKRCNPEKGDVLYTKNGTIGIAKLVDWDYEFSIFVSLCLLKPRHDLIHNKFLESFLNTPFALKQAMRHSKTGTITNLHLTEIKKIKIPLPSMEIQLEFVNKVQAIDAQKALAQKSLEKSEELFNSLLQKAFKGELV